MDNGVKWCMHLVCRQETCAELAWIAETLNRPKILLIVAAIAVGSIEVRCRHNTPSASRDGRITAPLPPRRV